jgi:hypothetical protein
LGFIEIFGWFTFGGLCALGAYMAIAAWRRG